jgi:galactokinase
MIDIADRPEIAPELRLVPHAFRRTFGRPAEGVWYAPGVLNLLGGAVRVPAKWGAIVAGDRRDDGKLELVSVNRPTERALLPSGEVPAWAAPVAGSSGGATLMCSVDLPQGSGLSAGEALRTAVNLALRDLAGAPDNRDEGRLHPPEVDEGALHRFLVVDTRVRRAKPQVERPYTRHTDDLGAALTAYHQVQDPDPEQDAVVRAALAAGARGASMLIDPPGRPAVALVDADLVPAVKKAITKAVEVPPRYLTIVPAPFKTAASR